MRDKVNLAAAFASFEDRWSPKKAAEVNGHLIKLVKFEGEFCWHHHDQEDELFWVVDGRIRILLRDREVALGPGEFFVVPRGVEHKPVADGVAHVVLVEPGTTRNTGDAENAFTRKDLDWL